MSGSTHCATVWADSVSLVPKDYAPTPKEREYIRKLEDIARRGEPMTPLDFCKRMGLRGTRSIRRYQLLKAHLNEYGWLTAKERMRGKPVTIANLELGEDPRVAKLQEEVRRLTSELGQVQQLKAELEHRNERLNGMRSILMAMLAHFAGQERSIGKDIEARLFEAAKNQIAALDSHGGTREYGSLDAFLESLRKEW